MGQCIESPSFAKLANPLDVFLYVNAEGMPTVYTDLLLATARLETIGLSMV
jgi:hypothetical protein